MKYLGFLPKEVPTGEPKLTYYLKAGIGKITPSPSSARDYGKREIIKKITLKNRLKCLLKN